MLTRMRTRALRRRLADDNEEKRTFERYFRSRALHPIAQGNRVVATRIVTRRTGVEMVAHSGRPEK